MWENRLGPPTVRRNGRSGTGCTGVYLRAHWLATCIGLAFSWTAALNGAPPHAPEYRIETFAGNGKPGDIPARGGQARDVPFNLPFGVERGPDGALFVTCVGTHRVLRIDSLSGHVSPFAGNGHRGYAGDGGAVSDAMLNER